MHKPRSALIARRQRQRASARRARIFYDVVAPMALMFAPLVAAAVGLAFALAGL